MIKSQKPKSSQLEIFQAKSLQLNKTVQGIFDKPEGEQAKAFAGLEKTDELEDGLLSPQNTKKIKSSKHLDDTIGLSPKLKNNLELSSDISTLEKSAKTKDLPGAEKITKKLTDPANIKENAKSEVKGKMPPLFDQLKKKNPKFAKAMGKLGPKKLKGIKNMFNTMGIMKLGLAFALMGPGGLALMLLAPVIAVGLNSLFKDTKNLLQDRDKSATNTLLQDKTGKNPINKKAGLVSSAIGNVISKTNKKQSKGDPKATKENKQTNDKTVDIAKKALVMGAKLAITVASTAVIGALTGGTSLIVQGLAKLAMSGSKITKAFSAVKKGAGVISKVNDAKNATKAKMDESKQKSEQNMKDLTPDV